MLRDEPPWLLCYLYSIAGNHILSAQEEDNDDNGMNYVYPVAGKYPAICAFDPNQLRSSGAKWVLFNTWSGFMDPPDNSDDHTRQVYNHDYVITLDELPSFQ